ncbi:MAG: hypothetical protein DRI61_00160 [Chloroflexi bacterium]|nr:MAG: hypothetical protein DRI61_00160 [Chloroflexota bacterium]HDN80818.1 hypothetical protein [Chloroflexota bacterium]
MGGTGVGIEIGVGVTTSTGVSEGIGVGEGATTTTVRLLVTWTKFQSIKSPIHTITIIINITIRKTMA